MPDATPPRRRVLLIGWDAADWSVITPLLDAGRMPHLTRLVESGVMGNLASLVPCLSPMLWTSAATGKTAEKHGILGFVEPDAAGLRLIPAQSGSRRCKALWDLLGEAGLQSCVVAWPVSDPAEPIRGVCVSERMTEGLAERPDQIRAVPAGCVHPATLEPFVSELRLHPCELTPGDLAGMIPEIAAIDLGQDERPAHLARLFARCASVHAVATAAMAAEPWDFFAVYYDAIDRAGHGFMAYRAPRMAAIPEADQRRYGGVIDGVYAFHDAMLGRLLELAGADTTVILMSDHGFQSGARRPATAGPAGAVPAEGADWHRMLGVLALAGPGIRRDERIYGASLLDITPTVLHLFGLPVGRDMDGRVLTGAFSAAQEVRWVETWEDSGEDRGEDGRAPRVRAADPEPDPAAHEAALRQLIALGYLAPDALAGLDAVAHARREAQFNLATVHQHHGRPGAALPLFADLCAQVPTQPRYQVARLHALAALDRHREVLELITALEAQGQAAASLDLPAAAALGNEGRDPEAQGRLAAAARRNPADPAVHQVAGDYHLSRGRLEAARACYLEAIRLDPDQAQALGGLAQVALERGDFTTAAEQALCCLQQAFFNPLAQFRLARALEGLGERAAARRHYGHALEQAPWFGMARLRLADLLEADGDLLGALDQRQRALGFGAVPRASEGSRSPS